MNVTKQKNMMVTNETRNSTTKASMKCILVSSHGIDVDSLLYQSNSHPKPTREKGEVLLKVQACSLAPGDVRVLTGHCDFFQEPPQFPYIPGGDVAGSVVEADENSRFKVGDNVIALFVLPRPLNGLAEYISVKENLVEMAPKRVSPIEASSLPSSALCALTAAKYYVKSGDRVLVLGGSGAVGTFFIQLAKNLMGASFIVTTSTADKGILTSLGADKVINYKDKNWWQDEELLKSEPFDLVVDLAVGNDAWAHAKRSSLLKPRRHGGKFLAVTADKPLLEIHSFCQALTAVGPMQFRALWTAIWPFSPQYIWHSNALNNEPGSLAEVANLIDNGSMKVVLDPISPLSFTEKDVKRGFHLMKQRHAHGKVVVSISQ